jgi:hypothetical protein
MKNSRISLTNYDVFQRDFKVSIAFGAKAISILALVKESNIPSIRPIHLAIDFRYFPRTIVEIALS